MNSQFRACGCGNTCLLKSCRRGQMWRTHEAAVAASCGVGYCCPVDCPPGGAPSDVPVPQSARLKQQKAGEGGVKPALQKTRLATTWQPTLRATPGYNWQQPPCCWLSCGSWEVAASPTSGRENEDGECTGARTACRWTGERG